MKKFLGMLAASVPGLAAFAEGESAGGEMSAVNTAVEGMFDTLQGDLSSLIGAALPVIITVCGAGLVIWAGLALVGTLKSAFSRGKGR